MVPGPDPGKQACRWPVVVSAGGSTLHFEFTSLAAPDILLRAQRGFLYFENGHAPVAALSQNQTLRNNIAEGFCKTAHGHDFALQLHVADSSANNQVAAVSGGGQQAGDKFAGGLPEECLVCGDESRMGFAPANLRS